MASASAASLRPDFPTRKPVASEAASDTQPMPLVRQAFGADVVGARFLSPARHDGLPQSKAGKPDRAYAQQHSRLVSLTQGS